MNLWVPMQIARNLPDMEEVDFSTPMWREFYKQMNSEGVDLSDHLPSLIQRWTVDDAKCIYMARIDARFVRNMWLNHEEKLEYCLKTGSWIPDTVIPPHEWMCPGRGDSYWWWGADCPYVIGVTLEDLTQAQV
jgi:hypothetical protein